MALQVNTGYGSIVALGISLNDVATLASLSRRFGSWMTAASGDEDFLRMLDQDEMDILRRRGLLDVARFNKQWGSQMRLLTNSNPTVVEGQIAEKALGKLGRFTATMVCVVAALDTFASSNVVNKILRKVLLELLRTTDYGADVLASQYSHRLNSWRSSAILRGLSGESRQIRRDLLQKNLVVDGLMPADDALHVATFLVWLLAESSEMYMTPSSDIAGIALCLSRLGMDTLAVEGFGVTCLPTSCQLIYTRDSVTTLEYRGPSMDLELLRRVPCTTVSLQCPEESLTNFPIDAETANRCRAAWREGSQSAGYITCRPLIPAKGLIHHDDLKYVFYDSGNRPGRVRTEIHQLASGHAFVVNRELCSRLEQVFQHESSATLEWLLEQTTESMAPDAEESMLSRSKSQVWNFDMQDHTRINAFTVFQAFILGYFYSIFLKLVDTSTLLVQTVEGAWGYRSPVFLCAIRTIWLSSSFAQEPGIRVLRREGVISILSSLLLGKQKEITRIKSSSFKQSNWCLGIVGKKTLLTRSLLKPCRTIQEIGSFVILDVDVSGIPTDIEGLVRPGVATRPYIEEVQQQQDSTLKPTWDINGAGSSEEMANAEDATFHIEVDWEGNPETMLLCVRFNGRRIETINPANADLTFLQFLQPPMANEVEMGPESPHLKDWDSLKWTIPALLNNDPFPKHYPLPDHPRKVLLSLPGRPRLRYFAAEKYVSRNHHVRIATDSVGQAFQQCWDSAKGSRCSVLVVVNGSEGNCRPTADDWVSEDIARKANRLQTLHAKQNRMDGQALDENDKVFTLGRGRPETYLFV